MSHQNTVSGTKDGNSSEQKQESSQPFRALFKQSKCGYCRKDVHSFDKCPLFIRAKKEVEEENARAPECQHRHRLAYHMSYGVGYCSNCRDTPLADTHYENGCPRIIGQSIKDHRTSQAIERKIKKYRRQEIDGSEQGSEISRASDSRSYN